MNSYSYCWDTSNDKGLTKGEIKSELVKSIKTAIKELDMAHENYNFASGDLIDYYSYQIKAAQAKFDYFLKRLKQIESTSA
jgi:hypothetical protein